ncbi:MAG: tetratricopeptide repeat protein, partial [Acidobacteria bacterium]|nr:tetratricopeptide repeat protein [Acidobacteriota bacterium]
QYDQSGDAARAEEAYRKIQRDHPEFEEGMFRFANFLVRAGNNTEALEIVELFAASSNFRFDYFLIKGLALEEKGAWEEALANLLEARKLYGGDTRVLNALGGCYYRTGKKAEAREALNASLRLASGQAEVRALLERIEKERPEDPPTAFD